jgi:NADH:ubiquinone oxidoreductase subunit 4 (subunit M)
MFDPIRTKPERARVRFRDIAAAWVLVVLILAAGVLPGVIRSAEAEAIHAATAARCEVATVLHSVPKLLQRHPQA